jgi:hypothetical protein
VVTGILQFREKLGDSYLEDEYHRSRATESEEHAEEVKALESEVAKKKNGFGLLLGQVAGLLLGRERSLADPPEESIAQQQSFISQRIYNHMAMLGSTPRTLRGEAFSIHKELTEGIAEKIGLGLYLSPRIDAVLRQETQTVLVQLAREYQEWLIQKTQEEPLQTTWGFICLVGQKLTEEQRATFPLILVADVQ